MTKWTDEQLKAINDTGSNILVSAGAGSGKTAVLSERVLTKVLNGVDITNILVLTFTNAAAKEMKDRIKMKILDAGLKEQASKIDAAYISTFDAFALSVVKKYHYLLNVSSDIEIASSSVVYLKEQEILDNLFLKYYEENNESFLKLIDNYTLKDDADLKKYIYNTSLKIDLIYDDETYLEEYIDSFYKDDNINSLVLEYVNYLKSIISEIDYYLNNIRLSVFSDYYDNLNQLFNNLLNANSYLDIKRNVGIEIPKLPNNSKDIKPYKDIINKNLNKLKDLTLFNDEEDIKNHFRANKDYVIVIVDIIKEYKKLVKEMKLNNNLFEFLDIAKMAIKVVKEFDEAREFYKNKFDEILIDEYQDTSDLQELFIENISNNNVYMVGDIKQSIYRFRNANPYIFKNKYANYYKNIGGQVIDLNKNFRSREEVLNNINLIFDYIMDEEYGGSDYRLNGRMIFGNKLYNEIGKVDIDSNLEIINYNRDDFNNYSKSETEIFIIANDIKKKIDSHYVFSFDDGKTRKANYSDFAILLDRANDFALYKKIFEYLNIPLSIYKDEDIYDSLDIKIIKNIIKLIICIRSNNYQEEFKYALMSILRSYLFRLSDDEIFSIINDKLYLSNDAYLKAKSISKMNISISNLLETIINEYDFYKKLVTVGGVKKHIVIFDYLISDAKNIENIYTLEDYYNYLDKITMGNLNLSFNSLKDDANSVKLMTIHKSKGLEFPICYFAGLDREFNISDIKDSMLFDKKYGLIIPNYESKNQEVITKCLLKQNFIYEEISEKIRLFYVALTRAKEKMIFVTNLDDSSYDSDKSLVDNLIRNKYRSFKDILESIYKHIKVYFKDIDLYSINMTKDYNLSLRSVKNDFSKGSKIVTEDIVYDGTLVEDLKFSKSSKHIEKDEEKDNLSIGLEIHNYMESLDLLSSSINKSDKYYKYYEAFKQSGVLDGVIKYYQEYEFMYEENNTLYHGIIDLLLEYEDKYLIIDYKLKNVLDDAYKKQLNGYKKYISSLTDKPVLIKLYSFLDNKFLEVGDE